MIIGVVGALVGWVCDVRTHPQGTRIWIADVDLGDNKAPIQIVFGGERKLVRDELAPVAPPGSRIIESHPRSGVRAKKVRTRRFRKERSHGMLCSLDELGWLNGGPDEVAVLRDVMPGQSLDDLPTHRRPEVVVEWDRVELMAQDAMALGCLTHGLQGAMPWPLRPPNSRQT